MKNGYIFTRNGKMYIVVGSCIDGNSHQRLLLCQEMSEGTDLVVWPMAEITGNHPENDETKPAPSVQAHSLPVEKNTTFEKPNEEMKNQLQDVSDNVIINESSESAGIQTKMEAFFEADTAGEKLELLRSMKNAITENMLESLAISLDFELSTGDLDEKYYSLERYLRTRVHFEGRRPR